MSDFKGKSYVLTGAAGFIGGHLGNRLTALGAKVIGIDNYLHPSDIPLTFKAEHADVRFPEYLLMRAVGTDAIIHLAAAINIDYMNVAPDLGWEINVDGTLNVLEVGRKLDVDVVFASSSEVYGTDQTNGMDESHPLDGQSPYAASKIAGDRACKAWADTYGMNVNVVRLFNTFGPYQGEDSYGGVIAKFARLRSKGQPLPVYGSGGQERDYLWIDDAIDAYLLALEKRFRGPVNFGTGQTISIWDLAAAICGTKDPGPYVMATPPRPGEVQRLRCNWTKAGLLGWEPKMKFEDGLGVYLRWRANQ